ncbi:CPXCG motif-containing cysteine-rich protein [Idiomarina tyrosinivorans]|uniref:CPXCG motif-containing cysteine-rich protein n=1 Tax=Idiomarina tyrosinivorans TaxID=1445662 RepID=A0A432ZQC2_9GAMM|nr:CPXCG motif-containing cysteine-rich protein [Idiomarina tyrosinivorans]RUO80026.1 CPXCG motif-containing cysteine-rich protein [Idiomarina tyrosinivorans]
MSLTYSTTFNCPYCMVTNDLEIDEYHDDGQQFVVDCQICCQPIVLTVWREGSQWRVDAEAENA